MNFIKNHCVCGHDKSSNIFKAIDCNFATTNESSEIQKCHRCKSIFPEIFPDSDSLGLAYKFYYTRELNEQKFTLKKRLLRFFQGSIATDLFPNKLKNLLDYGCGSGDFLIEVSKKFPNINMFGSDISKPPDGYEKYFKFYDNDNLYLDNNKYNWISLNHVFEHLEDSFSTIYSLSSILDNDGVIYVATPNANSILIDLFGRHARDIDFPRHRQIYSESCIKELFEKLGYKCTFLKPPLINTILPFLQSMKNLYKDNSIATYKKFWKSVFISSKFLKFLIINNVDAISRRSEIIFLAKK